MENFKMKNKKQIVVSLFCFAILLASSVFPIVKANAFNKETAVMVKLTLPGGEWIQARVIGDAVLKIKNDRTGQLIGFSMQVLDEKSGTVRVKSLEFNGGNDSSFRELESLDVSFKSPKTTSVIQTTNIEVLAITQQVTEKQSGDAERLRPPECCVTCGEITACANCSVTMSCGSCHTELCPK